MPEELSNELLENFFKQFLPLSTRVDVQLRTFIVREWSSLRLALPPSADPSCSLTRISELFEHWLELMVDLGDRLTDGGHLKQYEDHYLDATKPEDVYEAMQEQWRRLGRLQALQATCGKIRADAAPFPATSPGGSGEAMALEHSNPATNAYYVSTPAEMGDGADRPWHVAPGGATEERWNQAHKWLGGYCKGSSGTKICVYGKDCLAAGGVLNGKMVEFQQNAKFRDHLFKHIKPCKCEWPTCKFRFATPHQLKAHRDAVHAAALPSA